MCINTEKRTLSSCYTLWTMVSIPIIIFGLLFDPTLNQHTAVGCIKKAKSTNQATKLLFQNNMTNDKCPYTVKNGLAANSLLIVLTTNVIFVRQQYCKLVAILMGINFDCHYSFRP